ncbi:MAG: hypothetical protein ACXWV4_13380 [Flavitalea sp.]
MKPLTIVKSFLAASALLIFGSCEKKQDIIIWEPVDKTVTYKIFASKDYSPEQYDNTWHTVNLVVRAINLKSGTPTVIWDTIIGPNDLQLFPKFGDTITIQRTFTMIEEVEKINAAAGVSYNQNGQVQQNGQTEDMLNGQTTIKMMVDL